jgi:hypothetical protein
MKSTNIVSIEFEPVVSMEQKYNYLINVLKRCGGFDLSTTDKMSLIRKTLRDIGEEPTITPLISSRSP